MKNLLKSALLCCSLFIASINFIYAQTNDNPNVRARKKAPITNTDYNIYKRYADKKYLEKKPVAKPIDRTKPQPTPESNTNLFEEKKEKPIVVNSSLEPQDVANSNKFNPVSNEAKAHSLLNTKTIPADFPKYSSGMSSSDYETKVFQWFQKNPSYRKNNSAK